MHGPKPPAAVGIGFMPHKNLLALALARARVSPFAIEAATTTTATNGGSKCGLEWAPAKC
ncbi:unnamed protein product [Prunus armeniaca]|uniref:Uncharacterized protein n=1 Tax=Prunus armeniaca TaxID=36596 RepID=A0A6J5UB45_PRUAR|nr:unnamed protein product [Prunus armeniaca]